MKFFIVLYLLLNTCNLHAQPATSKWASTIALKIPDSLTRNTNQISSVIKSRFSLDSDRLKAIFTWEAINISYDVDNMFALTYDEGREDKISKALINRKAICEGYAELFAELANQCGIKATVIEGYTKQRGMVDYIPHAWVAANLYNKWYFFDPTWSSGYLENGKFVNMFSNRYYKVLPSNMIKTHMPFDPLYQFLTYPVSTQEFFQGKFSEDVNKPVFNFEDTLAALSQLSEIDKLKNAARRIEANGVKSSMILQRLQDIKARAFNIQANILNSAFNKANEAVILYNKYIEFKNKQFQPKKEDREIEEMLAKAQNQIDTTFKLLSTIGDVEDANFKQSMIQLQTHIEDMQSKVAIEKQFVNKYINTKKFFRPLLFKKFL